MADSGRLVLGVDIGGSSVKAGLVDALSGHLLGRHAQVLPAEAEARTEGVIMAALEAVASAAQGDAPHGARVVAVGIACPGLLSGAVLRSSANFPAWKDVDLEAVGRRLVPEAQRVAVANDANACAAGEAAADGPGPTCLAVVTLGTGVGVGVAIEGRPLSRNVELGHAIIRPGGRACACGQAGCWEAYCGAPAVAAAAAEALAAWVGEPSVLRAALAAGRLTAQAVFEAARAGDTAACAAVDGYVTALALGVLITCRAYDPQVVVLAGGVSQAGEWLLERLRPALADLWWRLDAPPPVRLSAVDGRDAGIVGAAACARTAA